MGNESAGPTTQATDKLGTFLKWLSLAGTSIAIFAAWKALPLDEEIKRLQVQSTSIENSVKTNDAHIRAIESSHKLTFDIYQEVQKVLRAEKRNPREEEAVRVLVQTMAEDPMRAKLLDAIALGATSPEVKQMARTSAEFYRDEPPTYDTGTTFPVKASEYGNKTKYGAFNIDFFFCEASKQQSEPLAIKAAGIGDGASTGRWRPRLLPDSVNAQAGYSIHNNVIRYNSDEKNIADALVVDIRATLHVEMKTMEIAYPTPNYVSVFFCSQSS